MTSSREEFFQGITTGLPVFFSYLPVAITFGLLARTGELDIFQTVSFSALVFAGASQLIALNLLSLGVSIPEIIATTFLVNLRHLLMSASLITRIKETPLLPILGLGVTDESFAIASLKPAPVSAGFLGGLQITGYLGWVVGTAIGFGAGQILPEILRQAMGLAIYALFIALLAPAAIRSRTVFVVAIIAGGINWGLALIGLEQAGIRIVLGILGGAAIGTIMEHKGGIKN